MLLVGGIFVPAHYLEPWATTYADQYTDPRTKVVSQALLAPSGHNMQPWTLSLDPDDTDVLNLCVHPLTASQTTTLTGLADNVGAALQIFTDQDNLKTLDAFGVPLRKDLLQCGDDRRQFGFGLLEEGELDAVAGDQGGSERLAKDRRRLGENPLQTGARADPPPRSCIRRGALIPVGSGQAPGVDRRLREGDGASQPRLTTGQRAADALRNGVGSWPFIGIFIALVGVWARRQHHRAERRVMGPLPILPAEPLPLHARGLQGAILLIAAKRQDSISAAMAQHDFDTNVASKTEIDRLLQLGQQHRQMITELTELVNTFATSAAARA
ncbi:hypothetical protein [Subtercola boreus]|uniref:hypothetical protein n=1 Tax=Subtercola boreus TaxID=120213 RepID=UPI00116E8606|nr:hypothetical protein FB464_2576 [Subtercola boreus]